MAAHLASLDIFDEVGMDALRAKSLQLTGFAEFLLKDALAKKPGLGIEIITPSDPEQRGCQLSLLVHQNGKALFDHLHANGVLMD